MAIYYPTSSIQEIGGQLSFSAGQIVQVIESRSTATVASANWATENSWFSGSITPTSASNKIHIYVFCPFRMDAGAGSWSLGYLRVRAVSRAGTPLLIQSGWNGNWRNTISSYQKTYVDSPGTTATQTYTVYGMNYPTGTCYWNNSGQQNSDGYAYIRMMEVVG
jgi:hypothetical protein